MFRITVTKCGNFVQTLEVAASNVHEAIAKAKAEMGLKAPRITWGEKHEMQINGWSGHMFEARRVS